MATQITKLDNGVTVVTRPFRGAQTTIVQWSVIGGSQIELPHEHGVGHFLEHVLVDRNALYTPIDYTGGMVNAYTSHSHIAMHAAVLPEHHKEALRRILQHGLIAPPFGEEAFMRESGTIREEITTRFADPDTRLYAAANASMFGSEPLGHHILGTHNDIDAHSVDKLRAYFSRVCCAPGLVVYGTGQINHRAFVRQVEPLVGSIPTDAVPTAAPSHFRPGETASIDFNERALPANRPVHVLVRFHAVSLLSPEHPAYRVLALMMSGGMESPLYQAMRSENGLLYRLGSYAASWQNDGMLDVNFCTSQPKTERALTVLANALASIPERMTEERFLWAQRRIAFYDLHQQEGMEDWLGRAPNELLLYDRIRERSELRQVMDAVTLKDVRDAAFRMVAEPPFVAALGPVEGVALKAPFDAALGKYYTRSTQLVP